MGIRETILEEVKKQGIAIGEAKSIQRAFEEGIKKGIEIGIKIGADKALKYVIAQVLQKGFSTEETVVLLNVTQEKVIEVISELAAGIVPTLPNGAQMISPS